MKVKEIAVMAAVLFIVFFITNAITDFGIIPSFGGLVDTLIQLLITSVLLLFVWKRAKKYA